MPRPGGESDKLGNRYEGVWTVDGILDVLAGDALSITIEPFGPDSLGIEFVKEMPNGIREFHSAKRQKTGTSWSLTELNFTRGSDSILNVLFTKLESDSTCVVKFVSGTTANELNELVEQASRSADFTSFSKLLDEAQRRRKSFEKHVLPLTKGDTNRAFDRLKRTEVIGITERELIRRVEQRISADTYRPDGLPLDTLAVRLLLAESVYQWFGQPLRRPAIIEYLAQHGYREREWSREPTIPALIAKRNATYSRHVEAELIQGSAIERTEAKEAFAALSGDEHKRRVILVGAAGLGKSCTVAQTLCLLEQAQIPVLAVRLDIQTEALTSDALGKQLGFPVSPSIVLGRVARGKRCVFLIDQLDALSFASGRNQHLWDAFDELLREAESIPNMRVLLACRAFDADHDPRLRRIIMDQDNSLRINLNLLTAELVRQTVSRTTPARPGPTEKQVELLRTPLHLSLYFQGNPLSSSPFHTIQDLFSRYWTHKRQLVSQQLGRDPKWNEVLSALAAWLSDHQTLSAPVDILDSWAEDVRVMASQCLLAVDEHSCRFFHEAFFDYVFARSFVSNGGKLRELLLTPGGEQHLFRRAQVRQILAYQRGRDLPTYLNELWELLSNPDIRFHIKKLAFEWLRSLDGPRIEEWQILKSFSNDKTLARHVQLISLNNSQWIVLLMEAGVWNEWLSSTVDSVVNHAVWLLSMSNAMKTVSDKIATLVAPYLDGSEQWRIRFITLVSSGEVYRSREMFGLFLEKLRAGWLRDLREHWWHRFDELPNVNPRWAVELLTVHLEQSIQAIGERNPSEWSFPFDEAELSVRFVHGLENCDAEMFIRAILPLVVEAAQRGQRVCQDGEIGDHLGAFLGLHDEYDFKAAFWGSLKRCMKRIALGAPEILEELSASYEKLPHRTIAILLLSGWGANAPRFADKAAEYILESHHRLTLGYSAWSGTGGDGRCAISREVLRAIAPLCSQANYERLEVAILSFRSPYERGNPAHFGFRQVLLLDALPSQRMSAFAASQLERLRAKFSGLNYSPPQTTCVVHWVGGPIPATAMNHMRDEHWISAMVKYSSKRSPTFEDWGKGGMHELAQALRTQTQANKMRFAALVHRMPDKIAPVYFCAILEGLAETHAQSSVESDTHSESVQRQDLETLVAVIRRLHKLKNHPCGHTISSAIHQLDSLNWPDEIYEILTHYSLHDPDPEPEAIEPLASDSDQKKQSDPYVTGINTVRGSAALAIARLLFHDVNCWPKLETAVRRLITDRSTAVRAVAIECLIAFMNRCREESVQLFLKLIEGQDGLLGTMPFRNSWRLASAMQGFAVSRN